MKLVEEILISLHHVSCEVICTDESHNPVGHVRSHL